MRSSGQSSARGRARNARAFSKPQGGLMDDVQKPDVRKRTDKAIVDHAPSKQAPSDQAPFDQAPSDGRMSLPAVRSQGSAGSDLILCLVYCAS